MSDIKFSCPNCAQSFESPADMAGQTIDCPNCQKAFHIPNLRAAISPPARNAPAFYPSAEMQTNVKQGALIGSGVCLLVGLAFMVWSLFWFIAYVPLFFAAFVLSIIAMAQKRVTGGILLLLASCIIPGVLFFVLAGQRAGEALETLDADMEQTKVEMQQTLQRISDESMARAENSAQETADSIRKAFEGIDQPAAKQTTTP
jgi:hypothetical protein